MPERAGVVWSGWQKWLSMSFRPSLSGSAAWMLVLYWFMRFRRGWPVSPPPTSPQRVHVTKYITLELSQEYRVLMWKVTSGRCGDVNSLVRNALGGCPVQRLHLAQGMKPGAVGASARLVAP